MIEGLVTNTSEIDERAIRPAFGRMVEDHVEDDTDTRLMQCLHHIPKLMDMSSST